MAPKPAKFENLTEKQRQVVSLRDDRGFKLSEIAEELNMDVGNVGHCYTRAKAKMLQFSLLG